MGYRNLTQCVNDLERNGHLLRITDEIDPDLEMAEIQRRVFARGGPAILFENVKAYKSFYSHTSSWLKLKKNFL